MSTVIERIKSLRANRQGRYHDLVIEAGSNGEFIDDDLRELDEIALLVGKSERALTDDLAAATRWHQFTGQLRDAEAERPAAERNIDRMTGQIKEAVKARNAANDAKRSAQYRRDGKGAKAGQQAYTRATGEISRLESELKQGRRPLAACEVLPKQISALVAANPWLKGKR